MDGCCAKNDCGGVRGCVCRCGRVCVCVCDNPGTLHLHSSVPASSSLPLEKWAPVCLSSSTMSLCLSSKKKIKNEIKLMINLFAALVENLGRRRRRREGEFDRAHFVNISASCRSCRVATRRPSPATNRPCKPDLKRREQEGGEEEEDRPSPSLFSPSQHRASLLTSERSFIHFLFFFCFATS